MRADLGIEPVEPRSLGTLRCIGVCPPSKPYGIPPPDLARWPFMPRPEEPPCPAECPRPTRRRSRRDPGCGERLCRRMRAGGCPGEEEDDDEEEEDDGSACVRKEFKLSHLDAWPGFQDAREACRERRPSSAEHIPSSEPTAGPVCPTDGIRRPATCLRGAGGEFWCVSGARLNRCLEERREESARRVDDGPATVLWASPRRQARCMRAVVAHAVASNASQTPRRARISGARSGFPPQIRHADEHAPRQDLPPHTGSFPLPPTQQPAPPIRSAPLSLTPALSPSPQVETHVDAARRHRGWCGRPHVHCRPPKGRVSNRSQ